MWKGDFRRSQAAVLMTILSREESSVADGSTIPFSSVAALMHNVGYTNFTYKDFLDIYDKVPEVQAMVANHNSKEITLGEPDMDVQGGEIDKAAKVDQMAKSATNANM